VSEEPAAAAPEEPPNRRDAPSRRRQVLLYALLFVTVALALHGLAPWILPLWVEEGPLLQGVTPTSATIVCFTSRASREPLRVNLDPPHGQADVRYTGRRQALTLSGLTPGAPYRYTLESGARTLAAGELRTPTDDQEAFEFLVFGDSGKASRAQFLLATRMANDHPGFVLHTGDLVYPDGQRHLYKTRFFEPYRELLADAAFWPCLGNHDVAAEDGGQAYVDVFELPENGPPGAPPERNYWFDYGTARVVVLDSNAEEAALRDAVAPWLREALSDPKPRWRFVALHHPPYTVGQHAPDQRVQRALTPVFDDAGVDIVFAGHDHTYQRTQPVHGGALAPDGRGVVYVVSGAGGAQLYSLAPQETWPDYLVTANNTIHSYTRVAVDGRRLTLEQVDVDGRVLDQWTHLKP
jgi:hypothetical protein